eukprot:scaffold8414_cov267-Pinguiococcus_pyrenoidosus.AAC.2
MKRQREEPKSTVLTFLSTTPYSLLVCDGCGSGVRSSGRAIYHAARDAAGALLSLPGLGWGRSGHLRRSAASSHRRT